MCKQGLSALVPYMPPPITKREFRLFLSLRAGEFEFERGTFKHPQNQGYSGSNLNRVKAHPARVEQESNARQFSAILVPVFFPTKNTSRVKTASRS